MPLSPLEAAHRIDEHVTVEMLVKAAKNCSRCSQIFLDSEEDHHNPENMAVAVSMAARAKFKEALIDDPASHFRGKTIRVSGAVILKNDRLEIEVNDPRQIEIVENARTGG
jgi:DNA/RNA endonuclease YhcR with UshA esterase domain